MEAHRHAKHGFTYSLTFLAHAKEHMSACVLVDLHERSLITTGAG